APAALIGLFLNSRCMRSFQATAESRLRIEQPDKAVRQYLPAALQARMGLLELGMPPQKLTMLGPRRTGLPLRLCQLAKQQLLLIAQPGKLLMRMHELALQLLDMRFFGSHRRRELTPPQLARLADRLNQFKLGIAGMQTGLS